MNVQYTVAFLAQFAYQKYILSLVYSYVLGYI